MFDTLYNYRNNQALVTPYSTITYGDMLNYAESLLKHISSGLCAVIAGNNSGTVISYIGLISERKPVLLLNDKNNCTGIYNTLTIYKPSYIIANSNFLSNEFIKSITDSYILWYNDYYIIKTNFNIEYNINPKLSLLLTTSGSTGSSKFVRLSFDNIVANTNSIINYLKISNEDRVITTLPFAYSYGLSIINTHLYSGATIILSDYSIVQREFWHNLKEYNATTFGGVPYTYEMMQKFRFANIDIPSIKYLTQAGGKLNNATMQYFIEECEKKDILFYTMYGQTEATARISYLNTKVALNKIGSIGKAIPNGMLYVVDDNGNKLSANKEGELLYEGSNVFLGYAESYKDLALDDENNGVLHTGDIGYYDEDGFFYITGRKKRFLKVFGNRINLDEIENNLLSKGYECACSGVDDKISIYVCSEKEKEEVSVLLKDMLDIHTSGYKVNVINNIPRTSSGKIQYHLLG